MFVMCGRMERFWDFYYSLVLVVGLICVGQVGDYEVWMLVYVELLLKYYFDCVGCLTQVRDPDQGQCLVGSLTGVVAS